MARQNAFESLPVELIADILGELDLSSLVTVSYLSRRLRAISSDSSLNPWRRPILRALYSPDDRYDPRLKSLSVRSTVPRQNFIEILSLAQPRYLLFEAALPNLKEQEWQECFRRRFLPSWTKVKKEGSWKEAFMKVLYRIWHRTNSSCTSDEAWTKYVTLNRNGISNQLESTSHGFNPLTIFEEMRLQNDLLHLQPSIRVLVEFPDVRVLAVGVLNKRSAYGVNPNAKLLLHPPGIEKTQVAVGSDIDDSSTSSDSDSMHDHDHAIPSSPMSNGQRLHDIYRCLVHPLPIRAFQSYPFHTPGGADERWRMSGDVEEGGLQWVGGMMITAQLVGPKNKETFIEQDSQIVEGTGRTQFASFTFEDLGTVAPWLETKQVMGPGLGHDI